MIISFFGHADFIENEEYKERFMKFLDETVGDKTADFYLGGYGNFDAFAYRCCKEYKRTHSEVSLVFVTPYMTVEYQKNHLLNILFVRHLVFHILQMIYF